MTLCLTHLKVRPQAAVTDAMPLEIPGMEVEDLSTETAEVRLWQRLPSLPR